MPDFSYFTLAAFAVIAIFLIFALIKSILLRLKKPKIGDIIGKEASAVDDIDGKNYGFVLVDGEFWKARSKKEHKIQKGEKVKITGKEDYILIVEPIKSDI